MRGEDLGEDNQQQKLAKISCLKSLDQKKAKSKIEYCPLSSLYLLNGDFCSNFFH